jgi:WD40 repeat protein
VVRPQQQGDGRVAFSPDGERIATASLDKTARIWRASAPQGRVEQFTLS